VERPWGNLYMLSREGEAPATKTLSYWAVLFDDSHLPPSRHWRREYLIIHISFHEQLADYTNDI
jgi:hypothetical protein